jgi:hypothetical protein
MTSEPKNKRPIICEPCGHECDVLMSFNFGKVAYEAYSASVGGVSVHGESLPSWDDLTNDRQFDVDGRRTAEGWMRAADAVRSAVAAQLAGQVAQGYR